MIELKSKTDCCGCSACKDACGHDCITMVCDDEGFVYPRTDKEKCVNCGLCDKVCPIINTPRHNNTLEVIAAKNRNNYDRFHSSSGGVFILLATTVLMEGGLVVGCRFNEDMEAVHTIAGNMDELEPLLSSKYVQSNTEGIYKEVRNQLKSGRKVLFSGVPCQVAALQNFLTKPYDNLITVDVLCHGVPSPKIFKEYIERLEERHRSKVRTVSFRWKEKGWKRLHMNAMFANGSRHHLYSGYDSYMQLFLTDCLQRPSCFQCPYNTLDRPGDISLGDFWGIGKKHYDFDDNKGVSLVIVNNRRGRDLWDMVSDKTIWFTSDTDMAVSGNKVLSQHLPSITKRDEFYKYYVLHGFDASIDKYAPEPPKSYQRYRNIMRLGLDIIRKIKKEGF